MILQKTVFRFAKKIIKLFLIQEYSQLLCEFVDLKSIQFGHNGFKGKIHTENYRRRHSDQWNERSLSGVQFH